MEISNNSRSLNFHNMFHTNECYQFWENFVLYLERACGEFMQKAGNWRIMEKMQIWLLPVLLSGKILWGNIMYRILKTPHKWLKDVVKNRVKSCGTPLWKSLCCVVTPCPTLNPKDYIVWEVFWKRLHHVFFL